MGWPQCPEQNHLGEQAVCPKPGRFSGAYPSQDREFRATSVHPSDSGGSADPGTRPSSRQSISVPLSPDRRHVPPGHRGESPQKDPERHRIGASQILRFTAHVRHRVSGTRHGHQDTLNHHRPCFHRNNFECLRPCHGRDAENRGGKNRPWNRQIRNYPGYRHSTKKTSSLLLPAPQRTASQTRHWVHQPDQ